MVTLWSWERNRRKPRPQPSDNGSDNLNSLNCRRGQKWQGRILRICLWFGAVLVILPAVLLHLVGLLFSLHDRNMRSHVSRMVIDSFDHRLHYYELQQPSADWEIIFIHGTPASAAVFGEQFKHPFPHANLVALDRPGFGSSGPAKRKPSLDDQANALEALLSRAEHGRTILVGHSYGAPVALLAALRFTNQIAGVLLIGGSIDPAQERIYMIQRIADWSLVSWLLPRPLRQCNRELLTLRKDLELLRPRLKSLEVPVVMLHGGKDHQVPVANVEYLRGQLAAAGKTNLFSQIVIPQFNHFIPWEHPEAVEAALSMLTRSLKTSSQIP
jgi:pimeloyl-ACP methyl ester carboxylesterase